MSVFFRKRGTTLEATPELLENFADNSWETIIWACQTENVLETWTVGSQKTMTINGTDYPIDIIGLYHDEYADGSGKAPITFQMHDCYNELKAVNGSNTNIGGWSSCQMRITHLPAILQQMPQEVVAKIKAVQKLTSAGNVSTEIQTTKDLLFLLSEIETGGVVNFSVEGEGEQYAYYVGSDSRKKLLNGDAVRWHLRSPVYSNAQRFCYVDLQGNNTNGYPSEKRGVAPAFCF